MQKLSVEAKYRSDKSKSHTKALRKQGYVTGNVFGKGSESVPIELLLEPLAKQIKASESGITSLIDLKISDAPENYDGTVIIKDFTKDPVSKKVLDIQFQKISMEEKITVTVPVELVGEAPGAAQGGMIEQVIDELMVSCLPSDIPSKIEVDISNLNIGDMIRIANLPKNDKIEFLVDDDTLICSCKLPSSGESNESAEAEQA